MNYLRIGETYEIRNAQNYLAAPADGWKVSGRKHLHPHARIESQHQPTAPGLIEPDEYTGGEFNVFVLNKNVEFDGYKSYIPIVRK